MKLPTFQLERTQSLWENTVDYNLTETGVHPLQLKELLSAEELAGLTELRLGYGQTNGTVELRDAVGRLYLGAGADNVLVTHGSIEANFLAMWRLLEPGDEIALMLPNYMQIWGLAKTFGATVKPFHLIEETGWRVDLDELGAAVSAKTKVIAVCNPNNPTGAVLTAQEMDEIVRLAKACNAWIYADEVYFGAELHGDETPTFYGKYDRTLVCCGLSKAYALPGLRLGWLVGPTETIAELWGYHDYTTITAGILSNHIATLALQPERRKKILQRNRQMLRQNLSVLEKWIEKYRETLMFTPPQAGGMAFIRYAWDINSTELSNQLREDKSVFVVAGDCFGMDRFIRIGIGSETEYLQAGLARIDQFVQESGLK